MEKENFLNTIKIEKDKELIRIEKLQRDFEAGLIKEEDLPDADFEKVKQLYEKQIAKAEEKLQKCHQEIMEIRKKISS